jgi:ribosome-interacting GTPase 1
MGIPEKIKQIEEEMQRTQVNKATERHLGVLKARLARLRRLQEEQSSRGAGADNGYSVRKEGDATVVLLGLPSVGKSTLLNHLTGSNSKVAAYDFTTLTVIPGILSYKGAKIQVLDIPGIIKGASMGKGLGKRVLSATRSADLLLVMLDVYNPEAREILLDEVRAIGIRPDEARPRVKVEKRSSGGVTVTDLVGVTRVDEEGVKQVVREYGLHNAHVTLRQDVCYDQLIDVLMRNRLYLPSLTLVNKIDMVDDGYIRELKRSLSFPFIPVSADNEVNLDVLKEQIFSRLDFIRVYMKPKGERPDYGEPMIIRNGDTIEDVADKVHRRLKGEVRYTRIWGRSVRYGGQKVGLSHPPMDEDVITFYSK